MPWGAPALHQPPEPTTLTDAYLACTMLVWPALACRGCMGRARAGHQRGSRKGRLGDTEPSHSQAASPNSMPWGSLRTPPVEGSCPHCLHPALGVPGPSVSPCPGAWRGCSRTGLDPPPAPISPLPEPATTHTIAILGTGQSWEQGAGVGQQIPHHRQGAAGPSWTGQRGCDPRAAWVTFVTGVGVGTEGDSCRQLPGGSSRAWRR